MSIIGHIAGVPLFTTIPEALGWARRKKKKIDYHTHSLNGRKGYMGGANHNQASGVTNNTKPPNYLTPPTTTTSISTTRVSRPLGSSGNSGGGSGGY